MSKGDQTQELLFLGLLTTLESVECVILVSEVSFFPYIKLRSGVIFSLRTAKARKRDLSYNLKLKDL